MTTKQPIFSIDRQAFKKALDVVLPTVKTSAGLDILSNVLLSVYADSDTLRLTTTRIETTTLHLLVEGVKVRQDAEVLLPARKLADLVGKMTGDEVRFIFDKEGWWTLEYDVPGAKKPGSVSISSPDIDQFPSSLVDGLVPTVSFDAELFASAIKQGWIMMDKSGNYTSFNSTCLRIPAEGGTAVLFGAENTRGVARVQLPIANRFDGSVIPADLEFLIPQRSVAILQAVKFAGDTVVLLTHPGKNQIGFRFGATTIATSLIANKYPPAEQLFRGKSETSVRVSRADLERVASMIDTLHGTEVKPLTMCAENGMLTIHSAKTETGQIAQDIPVDIDGEPRVVMVNPGFLAESLASLGTKYIILGIEDGRHGISLWSDEKQHCEHMIFPMGFGKREVER